MLILKVENFETRKRFRFLACPARLTERKSEEGELKEVYNNNVGKIVVCLYISVEKPLCGSC